MATSKNKEQIESGITTEFRNGIKILLEPPKTTEFGKSSNRNGLKKNPVNDRIR